MDEFDVRKFKNFVKAKNLLAKRWFEICCKTGFTLVVYPMQKLYIADLWGKGRNPIGNGNNGLRANTKVSFLMNYLKPAKKLRQSLTKTRQSSGIMRTYILHDRFFALVARQKPKTLEDANYGKMRPSWDPKRDQGWYRCIARDRGYLPCEQSLIDTKLVDAQVVEELSQLTIPDGFRERVEKAVRSNVENDEALKRMKEIKEAVRRIDFSWEKGFLTPQEYIEKRNQLQREIESLRPVDYDDLIEAADLLENFPSYWEACVTVEDPDEARKQLLAKIVDRVFIYDDKVIAIALHGDYAVVLDSAGMAPDEIVEKMKSETKRGTSDYACTSCAQSGSDGLGTLLGCSTIIVIPELRF